MHKPFPWPPVGHQDGVRIAEVINDLTKDSKHLFQPPYGPVEISVAEITSSGLDEALLKNETSLREHLSTYHSPKFSGTPVPNQEQHNYHGVRSSFFLLEPASAWGPLPVTQDGILDLLTRLDVFPHIYRFLKSFGMKDFSKDESFAGFDLVVTRGSSGQMTSFEVCYLLKYIGKRNELPSGSIPWSIRHSLIYQKVNIETNQTSYILIRLPDKVIDQLESSVEEKQSEAVFAKDWAHMHSVCFSSVDDDLRNMINYLDKEITEVFDHVIMSGVEPSKMNDLDSIQTSIRDFKTLHSLSDQARRVISNIELNIRTLECFQEKIKYLTTISSHVATSYSSLQVLSEDLAKRQEEHQFALRNASAVLERAMATSQHLRDTISLRNSEISKLNTETTSQATLVMAKLAELSSRETHVVKTLTVLALVFVPASFVADFLQMGYITISREHPMEWNAEPGLKIYAVLAIPLIAVIMSIYGFVELTQRPNGRNVVS